MEMMVTNNNNNNNNLRIRVIFEDDGILNKTQSKQGLKHSWVLLKPHFTTIADVISHLTHSFQLHLTCPRGIILSIDGFVLPPFESTTILKDTDLICVKRKRSKLQGVTKAIEGAKTSIEYATQQCLPSGIKLLTDKEHDEETRNYQSDIDEDIDEEKKTTLPLVNASIQDVTSKKRKASSKIERLKTKKQRQVTPKSVPKKRDSSCERTPRKKSKVENRNQGESKAKVEVIIECPKKLKSTSDSKEEPSEKQEEKTSPKSQTCDGVKKACRSARRKKLQRTWSKINRNKKKMDKCEGQVSSKALDADSEPNKSGTTNIVECQLGDDESDDEGAELVPVEIRPGHIRFTPSDKVKDVEQNEATNGGDVRPTDNTAWGNHSVKSNGSNAHSNKVSKETFEWNGISNKRKGQKWGMQKQSNTSWNERKDNNISPTFPQQFGWKGTSNTFGGQKWGEEKRPPSSWRNSSDNNAWGKEKQPSSSWKNSIDYNAESSRRQWSSEGALDYEKLLPLTDLPKVGDIFAYRLLELSSSWCPELSSFRIGKVARFEREANKIVLIPDPKYPLNIKKTDNNNDDDDDDDGPGKPPASSMYDEDGTLEIDFPSLVDVRVVKRGDMFQPGGTQTPAVNGTAVPSETAKKVDETQIGNKNVASAVGNGEVQTSTPANGKKDVWEEISEALSEKKAQLCQDDCWKKKKENSANRSWSNRSLRGSALGPTMAMLRSQNGL